MPRILLIDDDARLRKQFAGLLRSDGYEIEEAVNGRLGVDSAFANPPDLIVCDITMPEMNGHRVLETLRADRRTAHVPFVFLTGWSEKQDIRTGMNLGADDYLTKPVEPEDLLAAVSSRLRRQQATARRPYTPRETKPADLESMGLTPREAEILFWVTQGKTNPETGEIVGVHLSTVKKHLESIFQKLGVETRTAAATTALEHLAKTQ